MARIGRRTPIPPVYKKTSISTIGNKVVALLHANGTNGSSTFTDSSPLAANWTAVNGAVISTTQSKFGGASASFPNATSYLTPTASSSNYAFGTDDFTIEMWVYLNSGNTLYNVVYDARSLAIQAGATPVIYTIGTALYYFANGQNKITATAPDTNSWHHLAVCRASGNTRMFLDGTQIGSTYTDSSTYIIASGPFVGNAFLFDSVWKGYIDEIRITNGYAWYTSNFTPSTTALGKGVSAAASLTVNPTRTAGVGKTYAATSALSVTPTATASATVTRRVTSTLSVTPVITASENKTEYAATTGLVVTPTVSASASVTRYASAAVTVTPTVSTTAAKTRSAAVSLTVTPSTSASASATRTAAPTTTKSNPQPAMTIAVSRAATF